MALKDKNEGLYWRLVNLTQYLQSNERVADVTFNGFTSRDELAGHVDSAAGRLHLNEFGDDVRYLTPDMVYDLVPNLTEEQLMRMPGLAKLSGADSITEPLRTYPSAWADAPEEEKTWWQNLWARLAG